MVWDTIRPEGSEAPVFEGWGGISYALEAFSANLPDEWVAVPIVKIGEDLYDRATDYLSSIPKVSLSSGEDATPSAVSVAAPNNRVTLTYHNRVDRVEQLSGGVPGWSEEELLPVLSGLDALYVNFISGFEMTLDAARESCAGFDGPNYVDLHSLFLGMEEDGTRVPRRLEAWREWFGCFDIVQMNRNEFDLLGDPPRALREFSRGRVEGRTRTLLVTLGESGAVYLRLGVGGAPLRRDRVRQDHPVPGGDPTGCGDVWGATFFSRTLGGDEVPAAVHAANRMASRKVSWQGARDLGHHLANSIPPETDRT